MKNKKTTIIIVLIVIIMLTILLSIFLLKKDSTTINEYTGGKDLTNIKQTIEANKEYYLFEDNNKKYIYYKTEVSCYSPSEIEIKSVDIKSKEYNNDNKLVLEIDVETELTAKTIPEGMNIDGYDTDSRDIIIEVSKDCQGLIVNGIECIKYCGGILYDSKTNKYGYVDNKGNIVIPTEYERIEYFNEDYLIIEKGIDTSKGIADKSGKILVPCKYSIILNYEKNTFKVMSNSYSSNLHYNKVEIIDINGNLVKGPFEIKNEYNNEYFKKYYIYKENEKYGIIDKDLNAIVEPKYTDIWIEEIKVFKEDKNGYEKENYIIVEKDNKIAVIDFEENIIIPFQDVDLGELQTQYKEYLNRKSN